MSRVKKGPGCRPQSAKRQQFMDLRVRGWSVRSGAREPRTRRILITHFRDTPGLPLAATREVVVSRTTRSNWARGYKSCRQGVPVGFVPPLERLAVREISPRFLSQDERIEIGDLKKAGLCVRAIADRLGRAPSTISRELRRNVSRAGGYRPFEAQRQATARRSATGADGNPITSFKT